MLAQSWKEKLMHGSDRMCMLLHRLTPGYHPRRVFGESVLKAVYSIFPTSTPTGITYITPSQHVLPSLRLLHVWSGIKQKECQLRPGHRCTQLHVPISRQWHVSYVTDVNIRRLLISAAYTLMTTKKDPLVACATEVRAYLIVYFYLVINQSSPAIKSGLLQGTWWKMAPATGRSGQEGDSI